MKLLDAIVTWAVIAVVIGVVVVLVVRMLKELRAVPHWQGRARVPTGPKPRLMPCPLCGYTFAPDDVYRRGPDHAIVHEEDLCGARRGRRQVTAL